MSFDFVKIFKEIQLYQNDPDINNFMIRIIHLCNDMQPDKSWDLFKELDYATEVKNLTPHVINTLKKETAPFIEQGFWFGLSDNGYLYFAVSDQYIAEEDNLDWIFKGKTYYPEQGDFNSKILRSIEDLADETELGNYAEYPLFLAYALKLVQASLNHYKITYPKRKIGYSVGYDSEDFMTCGWI